MEPLKSKIYSQLQVGDYGEYSKIVTERDIVLFGQASGDVNPIHFDEAYAKKTIFKGRIVHGLWVASLVSTCIGTVMPGQGSVYLGQTLDFKHPARFGDKLTAIVTIKQKIDSKKLLLLDCVVRNQGDEVILSGEARVIPPRQSHQLAEFSLPKITVAGL